MCSSIKREERGKSGFLDSDVLINAVVYLICNTQQRDESENLSRSGGVQGDHEFKLISMLAHIS